LGSKSQGFDVSEKGGDLVRSRWDFLVDEGDEDKGLLIE